MNKANLPTHIGIILDGNRRWAKEKGLPTMKGHAKGYKAIKEVAKHAHEIGVDFVSVYAFSTENWSRSKEEVSYLMKLAYDLATNEVEELHKQGAKVAILGSREGLSNKLVAALDRAEELTANNTKGTVGICFNYGGHQEIADAATAAIRAGKRIITPKDIEDHLYHPEIPPIDLLIRTSGEQRLSNYMLWRAGYSELVFVSKHMPDFTPKDLDAAIAEYQKRNRRFGGN